MIKYYSSVTKYDEKKLLNTRTNFYYTGVFGG